MPKTIWELLNVILGNNTAPPREFFSARPGNRFDINLNKKLNSVDYVDVLVFRKPMFINLLYAVVHHVGYSAQQIRFGQTLTAAAALRDKTSSSARGLAAVAKQQTGLIIAHTYMGVITR